MVGGPTIIAWLDGDQADLARQVAERLGGELVGVGSSDPRRAGELAKILAAAVQDDLRSVLAGATCDLVLLASARGLGEEVTQGDLNALLDAKARNVRVVSLSPLPDSAMDLHGGKWLRARQGVTPIDCVRFVPLARAGAGFVALRERLSDFGRIASMSIRMVSRPEEGSLGGHLFAAMQLAHSLLGEFESVDAAYQPPGPMRTLRPLAGDTLHDLHGGLSAHLRSTDGRAATLLLSDRGSRWSRDLTIVGEGGQMRVSDDCLEWVATDGRIVDSPMRAIADAPGPGDGAARSIANAIDALLSNHPSEGQPVEVASVLALGQAALLSTKTGQNESPETIQRMVRAG